MLCVKGHFLERKTAVWGFDIGHVSAFECFLQGMHDHMGGTIKNKHSLLDVDEEIAREWAIIQTMALTDVVGVALGDNERLIIATALIRKRTLVTFNPPPYQPVVTGRNLGLHKVTR